ncbi:hypothetical protein N9480_03105 [Planktomarina temperata]|nr:hypothetical protein [Planktomarina temperata]
MLQYYKSLGLALLLSVGIGSVGQAASSVHVCNFEMNDKVIFEGVCGDETTRISENVIVLGSSQDEYFVYGVENKGEWFVTWNGEPFANHAHYPLGPALKEETDSVLCLIGKSFSTCKVKK